MLCFWKYNNKLLLWLPQDYQWLIHYQPFNDLKLMVPKQTLKRTSSYLLALFFCSLLCTGSQQVKLTTKRMSDRSTQRRQVKREMRSFSKGNRRGQSISKSSQCCSKRLHHTFGQNTPNADRRLITPTHGCQPNWNNQYGDSSILPK